MSSPKISALLVAFSVIGDSAAIAVGCTNDKSPATTTAASGAGGADAGGPTCGDSGVSKGPWALDATDTGVTLRWEACRAGAAGGIRVTPEAGGAELTATSVETTFEVKTTYRAAFNPAVEPDWAGTWYMHNVALTGLSPATCYRYTLDADPNRNGRFCTARAPGDAFRFLAIADTNPGLGETTSNLLGHVLPYDPDFVIHGGDVQYYDSGLETWSYWFDKMQPMLSQGAFFAAIGNHETENPDEYSDYVTRYFVTSTTGYYTFASGGVHFFAMDSEQDTELGSLQGTWLAAGLEAAAATPGYRFSIVYLHKPFVTCGDKSQDSGAREQLKPAFDAYGVRLVVQGHMHGYERFDLDGLTYITTGGGGGALGKVDENVDRAECASRLASGAFWHALVVDVGPTEVRPTPVDDQGGGRDEAVIAVP